MSKSVNCGFTRLQICACMNLLDMFFSYSGRKKSREPKEENVTLGPTVREGEQVFGVTHIFASFNDTFIAVGVLSYGGDGQDSGSVGEGGTEVATCNHLCPSVVTAVVGVGKRR
ncbi:hypothetical protein ZIOFF_024871 [Zingiber officinale]|uniref:Uncharacterized protein n=1 Tax=Zingiber officinale TaxID=94328 RepID=A0A8J5H9G6_ZINOF|nr:hypothetical protein ZIOFF_024871 [Zingiber officinale]